MKQTHRLFLRFHVQMNGMWNKNEPSKNIWRTRDVAEMAAAMRTAPIFIDEAKSKYPDADFHCTFIWQKTAISSTEHEASDDRLT